MKYRQGIDAKGIYALFFYLIASFLYRNHFLLRERMIVSGMIFHHFINE